MAQKAAHLAVMRLSAMGDVAMTVPVLRALLKQHPDLRITVVSRGFFKPFFADLPRVEFFAVDLENRHKGMLGLYRLYRDIKALGVSGFADLHQVLRSKIVGFFFRMGGFPVANLDKGRSEKKALTRAENKIFKPLKSTVERYADVFRNLGYRLDLSHPEFPAKPELSEEIRTVCGKKSEPWIGIAPFAQHQSKVYPIDLMAEVISEILQKTEAKIFLFGAGKTEKEQLEQLKGNSDRVVTMAGKMKLVQELDLISHLDVMLSMDSGNAHMAAMKGVDTVTLWGATHPYAGFAPFAQPLENCITANRETYPLLPTSIYGNKIVTGYEDAMRTISVDMVVNRILQILVSK